MPHENIRFYRYPGTAPAGAPPAALPGSVTLEVFRPRLGRLRPVRRNRLLMYLWWYLTCRQGYTVYCVRDGQEVVHMSHVLTKHPRFRFMAPGDVEIGPSWTAPSHRGRGIFPAVLSRIVEDHFGGGGAGGAVWIFTDATNAASRRGIEKAGFEYVGAGSKSRWLGVYRITHRS